MLRKGLYEKHNENFQKQYVNFLELCLVNELKEYCLECGVEKEK